MDRKTAIRQLLLLTGGAMAYQACGYLPQKELLEIYPDLGITGPERALVLLVCNRILPDGEQSKGAQALDIGDFVLLQANDCLPAESRAQFMEGLRRLNAYSQANASRNFDALGEDEGQHVLRTVLQDEKARWEDLQYFISNTKKWTIEGYMTSRHFMTTTMPYEMAPGSFRGKVPVIPGEKINIYG